MIFNMEDATMKKIFISFAAFAVLLSCVKETPQNEQESINQNTEVEGKVVSIIANAPSHVDANASSNKPQQSGTRTQLASDGKAVLWSPGDVVKVCFEPPYSTAASASKIQREAVAELSAVISEANSSAVFTGIWDETKPMYSVGAIVYPASVNFTSSQNTSNRYVTTNVSYNLPVVQEAIEGTFAENLNLSYATVTYKQLYNNNPNVTFKNVCSLIRINLPETDYNVKSIMIESGNELGIMAGNAKLFWETSSTSTGLSFKSSDPGISESTPVTLSKADGSNLVPGASYYAVVWPNTHNKLDFTFTDASGKTCVKTLDPGGVYCDPGKCLTVNIKSLDFSAVTPFLDVTTTSITASKKGGTESFNVTANNDVTVTIPGNVGWITGSYSNGQCILEVRPNKESASRSATITISSGGLSRNVAITQPHMTYSLSGSALTKASDLTDGQMYVVRRQATNNEYWCVNGSGVLVDVTVSNTSNFTSQHVFIFNKDDSMAAGVSYGRGYYDKYSYMSAGAWQSAWNDQYLHHNFYLQGTKYYFSMYSGWKEKSYSQKTGEDFDIYKANDSNMVNWNGSAFSWGNLGTDKYKWTFYKAVEN